jgi:hypothetical protein
VVNSLEEALAMMKVACGDDDVLAWIIVIAIIGVVGLVAGAWSTWRRR